MRIPIIVGVAALVVSVSAARHVSAAPCTRGTQDCVRWVALKGGPARAMVYSNVPLDVPNSTVTRALIFVHGTGRNADHYFETATAAAFLAGALENTVIVAPHLIAAADTPKVNEVKWPNGGTSWRAGGMSTSHPQLSSFDLADELVRLLSDKKTFPRLTQIVIAGHSAGGQYVIRYAMANRIDPVPGVKITYVVANPSTYAWPTATRPMPVGNASPIDAYKESLGEGGTRVSSNFTYGLPDVAKVPAYNDWPSGLAKRSGYTAAMSDAEMRKNLAERPTTYLFGQVDVLPLSNFDSSAVAKTQGPTRRARGEAFVKFITDSLGAKPRAMIVTGCGHNDRCMFTADAVLPVIFPPQ